MSTDFGRGLEQVEQSGTGAVAEQHEAVPREQRAQRRRVCRPTPHITQDKDTDTRHAFIAANQSSMTSPVSYPSVHSWLAPPLVGHWSTMAPAVVEEPLTSATWPVLRLASS